jgi:hypothetical protein
MIGVSWIGASGLGVTASPKRHKVLRDQALALSSAQRDRDTVPQEKLDKH